jgi:ABC-type uncharacterized transport system ATPase subunit
VAVAFRRVPPSSIFLGMPVLNRVGVVSGAGKTTTFKILTGDEQPTEGTAFIRGYDIRTDMAHARRLMG